MFGGLFYAGSVLIPLLFGLVPGFLPFGTAAVIRWLAWLAALGIASWYGHAMKVAPAAYQMMAWGSIAMSAGLSGILLVMQTGQQPRSTRTEANAGAGQLGRS